MGYFQRLFQTKQFKLIVIILFFITSIITWFSIQLYHHYYLTTDDAYVGANIVQIAPRITGKVNQIYVKNNQYVKKDDPLFDLDPEPLRLAINSAKAELALATAELINANNTQKRILPLVKNKFLSSQEGDNAIANYKIAAAKVEEATAKLAQADLNLQYAHITAPVNGWITNMTLRAGNVTAENESVFALVSDEEFWIDANFKETQLANIKPHQKAIIISDMYPHYRFQGIVESISSGAGTIFSLLPPQNATGNWVKVTQRVPVRIRVLNIDPHFPLRVGTSVEVKIELQHTDAA